MNFSSMSIDDLLNVKNLTDEYLLGELSKNSVEQNKEFRQNALLASKVFKIEFNSKFLSNYIFWDNTTVSMKSPLINFVKNDSKVLEIGTGPSAVLSRFLLSNKNNLDITSTDIDKEFLECASKYKTNNLNGSRIKFLKSDLFVGVRDKFDLVFMNPPYVSGIDLKLMNFNSATSEYKAGYGGDDGGLVIERFLIQSNEVMKKGSVVVLGINNKYFSDLSVMKLVKASKLKLIQRYYGQSEVPPFSQVYILQI